MVLLVPLVVLLETCCNHQLCALFLTSRSNSCVLYAIKGRRDLSRVDEIEATVRPFQDSAVGSRGAAGSCSVLLIGSQGNSGQVIVCVSWIFSISCWKVMRCRRARARCYLLSHHYHIDRSSSVTCLGFSSFSPPTLVSGYHKRTMHRK